MSELRGGPSRLALLRALMIPVLPLRLPVVDGVPILVPCSALSVLILAVNTTLIHAATPCILVSRSLDTEI